VTVVDTLAALDKAPITVVCLAKTSQDAVSSAGKRLSKTKTTRTLTRKARHTKK
jgi:hypothetical protein